MGLFGISVSDIHKWEKNKEVDKIVPALSGKNKEVRLAGITAFGNLRVSNGAPFLINGLNDTDNDIRKQTRLALLKIGHPALADLKKAKDQISQAGTEAILQNVCKQVYHVSDFEIEYKKLEYLLKIYDVTLAGKGKNEYGSNYNEIMAIYDHFTGQVSKLTDPIDLVTGGIELLEKNEKIKNLDSRLLGDVVTSGDYFLVSDFFKKTENQDQRRTLFKALCDTKSLYTPAAILQGIKDQDSRIRAVAVENLSKTGSNDQFNLLVYMLDDSSEVVILEAAKSLGRLQNSQAIPPLQNALKKRPNIYSDAAQTILHSLVQLGHNPDIKHYVRDLDAVELSTRISAANALIKLAQLDFSLVRSQWNHMVSKIQEPNINHNDGKNFYYSDCGTHEDSRRHTDSPGIGLKIPDDLRYKR
jgi:hypothetical protein